MIISWIQRVFIFQNETFLGMLLASSNYYYLSKKQFLLQVSNLPDCIISSRDVIGTTTWSFTKSPLKTFDSISINIFSRKLTFEAFKTPTFFAKNLILLHFYMIVFKLILIFQIFCFSSKRRYSITNSTNNGRFYLDIVKSLRFPV